MLPKAGEGGFSWAQSARSALPAMFLAAVCLIPFLNKAYAIDDPYFVLMAQQAGREFWRPLHFQLCWFGTLTCGYASDLAPGQPLMAYLLLPLTGVQIPEWLVHLVQLGVLCAGALGTVALALRLGFGKLEARAAGIVLIALPPVLAMTNTAMPDILAMALGVLGIERFTAWLQEERWSQGALAAVWLGMAPLARTHLLALAGVVALMIVVVRWGKPDFLKATLRAAAPLAVALVIFASATWLTREAGVNGIMPPSRNVHLANIRPNLWAYLWQLVLTFPIAIVWLATSGYGRSISIAALIYVPVIVLRGWWRPLPIVVVGLACLAGLLWKAWSTKEFTNILLFAWLLVPLPALPYLHFPPKYLIASAPALAILMVKLWREHGLRNPVPWSLALAASLFFSVIILDADSKFAAIPRTAAAELIAPRVAAGERVWYAGQWGLYWYGQQAGARHVLPSGPGPLPGDLLVLGNLEGCKELLKRFPNRTLVERRIFSSTGGRTMDASAHAGLYSNSYGPSIWAWGEGEVNRYDVWRVN